MKIIKRHNLLNNYLKSFRFFASFSSLFNDTLHIRVVNESKGEERYDDKYQADESTGKRVNRTGANYLLKY